MKLWTLHLSVYQCVPAWKKLFYIHAETMDAASANASAYPAVSIFFFFFLLRTGLTKHNQSPSDINDLTVVVCLHIIHQ